MNTFGTHLSLTTFGESHGPAIGGILDGVPAGLDFDYALLRRDMQRRKPGQSALTTPRSEEDEVEILSGVFEGRTLGTPIAFVIRNTDQRSADYEAMKDVFRPGHADFVYEKKYGLRDYRGGGRSSARETAARVAGGAIARMLLFRRGISVQAYVSSVKDVTVPLPYTSLELSLADSNPVRCPHPATAERMIKLIEQAREAKDSVGGIITCVAKGLPAGLGDPVFDKLNARLADAMVSINAVKGFEMGDGFSATLRYGSENNDSADTNHDGGVTGGISNGKDLWFRVGFKPVSTIGKPQSTMNKQGEDVVLEATGRHDPCVLPRAVPIVEAMAALVIADALLSPGFTAHMK
ncbi:MAG: chorismate synthase [Flavobacteriales bacterium]|jgi:chorismate synthase